MIVFIMGAAVQLLLRRDIAPVRWAHAVRQFKININTARADQLQMLPGIGAKLAQRIIDYRKESGSFKKLEDLQDVDGLTAKRLRPHQGAHRIMKTTHRPCCWLVLVLSSGILIGHFLPWRYCFGCGRRQFLFYYPYFPS